MFAAVLMVGAVGVSALLTSVPTVHGSIVYPPSVATTPPPEILSDTPEIGETYRIGAYHCIAENVEQEFDRCWHDPDPVGNPVAMEPDNDSILAYEIPEPTNGSVLDRVRVLDDDPGDSVLGGFDCRIHGNGMCGPLNDGGFAPGCYDRSNGVLLEPWREEFYGAGRVCGDWTAYDQRAEDRINGVIAQFCAANDTGGTTCWFADESTPGGVTGEPFRV
jgi:hypothetical protein